MVLAWDYVNDGSDPLSPHKPEPMRYVDDNELRERTGVVTRKLNADNYEEELNKICQKRGYSGSDVLEMHPDSEQDYNEKCEKYFTEHLHPDEEIRLWVDGKGYFDVRDASDNWIRMQVEKGDLLILPPGIYHRFSPKAFGQTAFKRIFTAEPVWVGFPRPADSHPARLEWLNMASQKFQGIQVV
ncbi:1,2-dihydroxy-3-keto-5-methylthiopentene dioxygenase [Tetranychus urticae]|uniref:Acireductone dioxygenase n=1 Tax=Tetranychus urticae TaxID=32264 RepID=T1KGE4_TETUR|nr:1,2-dihydroxy-3-keto-5-methylthiopentene dioxygenase [Tetranychus urticae]